MSDIYLPKDTYEPICIKKHDGTVLSEFSFNPSDANIVYRYEEFVNGLEDLIKRISEYEKKTEKKSDYEEDKLILDKINKEIYEKTNALVNENVAENIFKVMGPLSPISTGDYYFVFIIEQIGKKIQNATGLRVKKIEMKIKKHTAKYHG